MRADRRRPADAPRRVLLAVAAGLVLADASVVTLALPDLLVELHTTVEGVAAVIGAYTVVLAITLIPFERAAASFSVRAVGAGGFALFAVASAACASADDLTGLLVSRCAQALGAAAGQLSEDAADDAGEEDHAEDDERQRPRRQREEHGSIVSARAAGLQQPLPRGELHARPPPWFARGPLRGVDRPPAGVLDERRVFRVEQLLETS